jgi:hypothetical protein
LYDIHICGVERCDRDVSMALRALVYIRSLCSEYEEGILYTIEVSSSISVVMKMPVMLEGF